MFMFVNADLNQKSNIFIRAGTKTWIWTFINNSYHVTSIRITWIVRFLLHVFTVGSCDSSILFVKQPEFILELFQNGVNCENCENRRETPGSLTKSFFLESNIFLIKMRIFFFSCNSHGWTVFDFFFRLKENLRGRCGWCWTEKEKTKTDQN